MKRPSGEATVGPISKVVKVDLETISLLPSSSSSVQISTSVATPGPNIPVKRIEVSARPKPGPVPVAERSVEEKRLLIRKQLVILLHAIVCRRRDNTSTARGESTNQVCIKNTLINPLTLKEEKNADCFGFPIYY